ncbi:MAG: hypothetical protein HYY46_25865 [Deltaproteobacteria bacterium]|nr:hypothetical protein [Deltaproteobacteria bacterium]
MRILTTLILLGLTGIWWVIFGTSVEQLVGWLAVVFVACFIADEVQKLHMKISEEVGSIGHKIYELRGEIQEIIQGSSQKNIEKPLQELRRAVDQLRGAIEDLRDELDSRTG